MTEINMPAVFGDVIVSKEKFVIDNKGVKIQVDNRNNNFIFDCNDETITKFPQNGLLSIKSGGIIKKICKEIYVIQCSKKEFDINSYTTKMHFDSSWGNASVDIKIPYTISYKIDEDNIEKFVNFIIKNVNSRMIGYNSILEPLEPIVNNIIKNTVGSSGIYAIEDLETDLIDLELDITDKLNNDRKIKDIGILVKKISLQIADDYIHRSEKKHIQRNNMIISKR